MKYESFQKLLPFILPKPTRCKMVSSTTAFGIAFPAKACSIKRNEFINLIFMNFWKLSLFKTGFLENGQMFQGHHERLHWFKRFCSVYISNENRPVRFMVKRNDMPEPILESKKWNRLLFFVCRFQPISNKLNPNNANNRKRPLFRWGGGKQNRL